MSADSMQAMVLHEFGGRFALEERPIPEPGPGEVLLRVEGVGAGLTLEHGRNGRMGGSVPRIMGHEYAGFVAALGPGVDGWREGDAVVGSFYLLCGTCEWCASGRETLCASMGGYIGVAVDGAFAEYAVVPARNLVRIPDGVSVAEAGVISDALATPYHLARERARIVPGQRVAVIGAGGGLGVHMVDMARAFGAETFAVERDLAKLVQLREQGVADHVIDASADGWDEALREASRGGVHAVVDTVGGDDTIESGVAALRRAGVLVVLGFRAGVKAAVDPTRLMLEEVTVTGTRYATRTEIADSLALVAQGLLKPRIGARFPLWQLNETFDAINANQVFGRIVVDRMAERPPA